jgi:TusA-related sulfurtransferase
MVDDIKADETLDCRGLSCPMPVLKAKKAISKMESGKILYESEVASKTRETPSGLPNAELRGFAPIGMLE